MDLVSSKSDSDLRRLLRETVPFIVHTQMVNTRTLKACGAVSPLFEYLAKKRGFVAVTAPSPGHFFNAVLTKQSTWRIDLSAIQFRCSLAMPFEDEEDEAWDEWERRSQRVWSRLIEHPSEAVDVERVGGPGSFVEYERFWSSLAPFDSEYQHFYDELLARYRRRGYRVPRHLRGTP